MGIAKGLLGAACLFFLSNAQALSFELEGGLKYFSYAEADPAPYKSTETGYLKDIGLSLKQNLGAGFSLSIAGDYAFGNLEYVGTDQGTGAPLSGWHNHFVAVGTAFLEFEISPFTLYGGLAFREWYRPLSGYNETYQQWYAPIGLRWDIVLGSGFVWQVDASVWPLFKAHLLMTDSSQGYDNATLPIGTALGWKIQLPLSLECGTGALLKLSPSYSVLQNGIGTVEPTTIHGQQVVQNGEDLGSYEPASTTNEYELTLSFVAVF